MNALIIDDHKAEREFLNIILKEKFPEIQLYFANSIGKGCEILYGNQKTKKRIDILISDLLFKNGINAPMLLNTAAADFPEMKIIATSCAEGDCREVDSLKPEITFVKKVPCIEEYSKRIFGQISTYATKANRKVKIKS